MPKTPPPALTYSGNLNIGDTVAITSGDADLKDPTSTEGDVAYLKITGKSGDTYTYEMADVEDVLFLPDVLPIQSDWDMDTGDGNVLTITAANLATAMSNVDAESLDVGDFLGFISGEYSSQSATANFYGKITEYTVDGDGNYIISYVTATETDIENALDVYYTQNQQIALTASEIEQIEDSIKEDVQQSNYAPQAATYLAAILMESEELTTVPDMDAVAQSMGKIDTYGLSKGRAVQTRDGKTVEVDFDARNINVKLGTNSRLDHLQGKGFNVEIEIPFTVTINDSIEIAVKATFEEEIILKQKISTKRHKIGFLKYDYSLNASFEVGNYTGIGFTADITTADGGENESMLAKLEEIMERMEDYHEAGGVTTTDGTMEGLSEIYQSVMDNANDTWIDIVEVKLFETNGNAFLHIFCWQIRGTFVVSANLAVSIGMSFEYTTQKQYNFSVRVKSKTSTNETIDIITPNYNFDFYVVGTIGIRAGIRLEMYVGLFSLKLDKIGITAEVGAYAQLWGYFFYHLHWKQGVGKTQSSAGAMLIEIGMYLDIKFVAQLFNSSKLSWCPTIYAKEWPLWSAGERQNVYDFAITNDTAYTFQKTKTLTLPGTTYAMKSMDLKNGNISQISKDDNTESHFQISFSNDKFQYNPQKNTVTVGEHADPMGEETDMIVIWKKAPLSFSSKPIQKVIHITWSDPDNVFAMSFDTMGGTAVNQIVAGKGAEIIRPENPEKVGYVFAGWYEDEAYSMPFRFSDDTLTAMPDHNLTLYAKWEPATDTKYTVEHYTEGLNGSYTLDSTETKKGTTEETTAATVKTLTGFTAKAIRQEPIAADGSTVIKIYYDRTTYTVTFKDGVSEANNIVKTYKYGTELAAPAFAREGYVFRTWDTTLPTYVTEDATYTATWEGKENTVIFDSQGGSAVDSVTVKTDKKITKPTVPTRDGHTFKGWYTDQLCTKEWDFTNNTVSGSMTLYAKWEGAKYTVNFNVNCDDGTVTPSTKEVQFGAAYGTLPTPTRTGYGFDGWFTEKDGGDEVTATTKVTITDGQTLYAHWTANTNTAYTVEHYQQNIENDDYTRKDTETGLTGTTGEQTAAAAKTYEGFTAKSFQQGTIAADGSTVVKIYYDRNTYTVTWQNYDGSTLETDKNVKFGATPGYDSATPTKELTGHTCTFKGWSPTVSAVTDNATYTATFTDTANRYNITYELRGGTNATGNPATYTYGVGIASLTEPSKTGHTFGGWFTDSSFTEETKVTSISTTQTGNVTLYAKWTANTYTVTFDVNGGDAMSSNTISVAYDSTYGDLPTPTYSADESHVFDGWYTEKTGGTKVESNTTVTTAGDHTLYAHWVLETEKISDVYINGESIQISNVDSTVVGYNGVKYDKETRTLTLNNANISGDSGSGTIKLGSGAGDAYTIELIGNNCISNSNSNRAKGIYATAGKTTFTGDGTLTVNASASGDTKESSIAIYQSNGGYVTIDGPAICAYAGEGSSNSHGVMITTGGNLSVVSGSLTAKGYGYAISAEKIMDANGNTLFVTAGTDYDDSTNARISATNENLKSNQYIYTGKISSAIDCVKIMGSAIHIDENSNVTCYEGISYDAAANILTLNGATIEATFKANGGKVFELSKTTINGEAVYPQIKVVGTNTVTGNNGNYGGVFYGIFIQSTEDKAAFIGDGTLNVSISGNVGSQIAINGSTEEGGLVIDGPSINASGDDYGVQVNDEGNSLIKIRSGSLTAQATYTAVNAANLVGADNTPITATVKTIGIEGESEVTITAENLTSYKYIATGTISSN